MPLTSSVLSVAARAPEQPAICGTGRTLRYGELVEGARRLYAAIRVLQDRRVGSPLVAPHTHGIPITAVSSGSAFEASRIVAELALEPAVAAVIDPRWPLAHRVGAIERCGIGVVVTDSPDLLAALRTAPAGAVAVTPGELRALEGSAADARSPAGQARGVPVPTVRAGGEPFLLLFSSGTTRAPKPFLKTRGQYRANFAIAQPHLGVGPGVHTIAPGPVSYALTLWALVECLASGGTVHVADTFDAERVATAIAAAPITRLVAVPAMLYALARLPIAQRRALASLELAVTGGASLSPAVRELWLHAAPACRVVSYYGASEIGFIGGNSGSGDPAVFDIYDGVEVAVRGPDGAALPDAELGTVWARTPACSDGYLGTAATRALRNPDGWATVGDRGSLEGGRLRLAGRPGDTAVTGGHKVSLVEVEQAFDGLPGLTAACAVTLPDPRLGSAVCLVLEGEPPAVTELWTLARARLAPQFVPRRWFVLGALPRTAGGKVRRDATAAAVAAGAARELTR